MLCIVSQTGYFQFLDIQQNLITDTNSFVVPNAPFYQLNTQGERVECFDLSASGKHLIIIQIEIN